ncbi:hypothetical protein ACHAWO_007360 [Cyclotella atomus]|uniref:Uncharacterized protein n=1 Tax=Cyclotella atomus TaxID=382360 RepID=A0ABD3NTS9_9STRA
MRLMNLLCNICIIPLAAACSAFTSPAPLLTKARCVSPSKIKLHLQNNPSDVHVQSIEIAPYAKSYPDRRTLLKNFISSTALSIPIMYSQPSAAVMSVESKSTLAPITKSEAIDRFRAGRKSVQYLLDHYDEICEGGGDNVRRYLGTVGVTSGLFGIGKALKVLGEDVDDIVEYTELATEVEKTIQQADGSAYMAIFVTTSSSSTPPAKYYKDAKVEIERCAQTLDELALMIGLK